MIKGNGKRLVYMTWNNERRLARCAFKVVLPASAQSTGRFQNPTSNRPRVRPRTSSRRRTRPDTQARNIWHTAANQIIRLKLNGAGDRRHRWGSFRLCEKEKGRNLAGAHWRTPAIRFATPVSINQIESETKWDEMALGFAFRLNQLYWSIDF